MSAEVRVCSWEDVSFSDAERLLELSADTESLQTHLAGLLSEQRRKRGEKQAAIELDLFTYAVLFCKKNGFSQEQLSAFFTILKSVHSMCVSTPYDNLQDTFAFFSDLLLRHSVQRPPFSVRLFSLSQVKAVTDYVLSTYFKHFKMYKFAFTERVQLSLSLSYSGEPEQEEEAEGERENDDKKPVEDAPGMIVYLRKCHSDGYFCSGGRGRWGDRDSGGRGRERGREARTAEAAEYHYLRPHCTPHTAEGWVMMSSLHHKK